MKRSGSGWVRIDNKSGRYERDAGPGWGCTEQPENVVSIPLPVFLPALSHVFGEEAAAADFVGVGEYLCDGFGVGLVLFGEDAGGEGGGGVLVEDGDCALEDDDAIVYLFVDEVNGAAGDFCAEVEGLGLGFEAGEAGEQAGVHVEDAVGEGLDEGRGDDAHVAGEADEVDLGLLELVDEFEVTVDGGAAGDGNMGCRETELACGGKAGCVGFV